MTKFYTNVEISGSNVLIREVVDGIPGMRKEQWQPTLYVKGKPRGETKKFTSLYGDEVYSIQPGTIPECKEFVEKYKGVQGFEIFGQLNYSLQYMHQYKPKGYEKRYVSIWGLDIETATPFDHEGNPYFPTPKTAPGEMLLITMVDFNTGEAFTWGSKPYSGKDTHYMHCENESTLLKMFLQFWEQKRPDIITGWNTNNFDLPYIHNRIKQVLGEEAVKKLSPWGRVYYKDKVFNGRDEYDLRITGVSSLDYIELYKKYVLTPRESYSLQYICQEELGEGKHEHDYESFHEFYTKDWHNFTVYNIKDTQLVKRLDDKLNLIAIVTTMAYEACINYEDVSSPVKLWDAIIANHCLDLDIVMPQQEYENQEALDGAYVKEPIPGWYKNVVSLDATSLYPSIMMTNNISPETWAGNCGLTIDDFLNNVPVEVDEKYIVTPIGALYTKDKRGVIPTIIEKYMKKRKEAKTQMLKYEQEFENTKDPKYETLIATYDSMQMAFKVALNSLYGGTANKYFRFFKHDHAASVTLTGQYVLRTIEREIDAALNTAFKTDNVRYLIYIDTDSLYFTLDGVFKKYGVTEDKAIKTIEKLAKDKITPIVNKFCQECCNKMHSYENKLSFKLEVAADKSIFVGKKKYTLRVHSSEGVTYAKPKFKVKGLEMVRSSTPAFVREKLKTALDVVFDTDEKKTQEFIQKVRNEFFTLPYTEVAFPRGANNLMEYHDRTTIYTKGVPIQVRGVLLYNHYLKQLKLTGKYPSIGEGDKIRFAYLKKPNKLKENVIAWPVDGVLPPEFGVTDKIDYEEQFNKTFLASMDILLRAIKWNAVETSSLEEFFG